ncbi:MAG: hypothetical protein EOP48_26040 [Sphingobacteriales bacterium]|nr:MAG: hypothetical protein EOP48_26040 [Sphingobacteriales bacterium]
MNKSFFKRLVKTSFLVLGILLTLTLFAVNLIPYLSIRLWLLSVTALFFPWIFIFTMLFGIGLILVKSRLSILVILVLISSWKSVSVTWAMNGSGEGNSITRPKLKVLSFNVMRWAEMARKTAKEETNRNRMIAEVLAQDADIMCFQEFFEPAGYGLTIFESNIQELKAKGYTYYSFFPTSVIHTGTKYFGMAIFSRYPISDSANFKFEYSLHSEGLMYVDINVEGKMVRVFNTHLESYKVGNTGNTNSARKNIFSALKNSASSVRNAYFNRVEQSLFVQKKIAESPYPSILSGNLGDVPVSDVYRQTKAEMTDVFLEKGGGFGRTFRHSLPNLRLDYMFIDKSLETERFELIDIEPSDHYALLAGIVLKEL